MSKKVIVLSTMSETTNVLVAISKHISLLAPTQEKKKTVRQFQEYIFNCMM